MLECVLHGEARGALGAHAATTIHSLVRRHADRAAADRALGWLLQHLTVCAAGRDELERARSRSWPDLADAVVAAAGERAGCDCIVTRRVKAFEGAPSPY